MWKASVTERTGASASTVWAIYQDVSNWPLWDKGIERCRIDGAFAEGTTGILQPVGGPELPFQLTLVEEGRRFYDSTPLGEETAVIGRHELSVDGEGTKITHIFEIVGPEADQMVQALGFNEEELRETVVSLARYAEGKEHE